MKIAGLISLRSAVTGRPAGFQLSKPPSSTFTSRAPIVLSIHQTRGAVKHAGPVIDDDRVGLAQPEPPGMLGEDLGRGQGVRQVECGSTTAS